MASKTIENLRLPYQHEGLILASSINDTIAPESSCETAKNIVFDKMGSIMTRKGMVSFAPTLGGEILSLGKFSQNSGTVRRLLAQVGNKIYSFDGTSWSEVRNMSGGGKARFSQFLNLVYTVNGSNGNNIQTFNGTSYGNSQVGSLPKGDYVHAGFEGRIWVADAVNDRLYYTDVVSPVGNITGGNKYIEKLSPQDGESITGLFRVPRALLLFKQNHIYRIYGSTAMDPFPAYNVGTYSQESIVETKLGIFFHHSSGFYWFQYEGQPQEISRRIRGIVTAIQRANYEKISGAYDGIDNVTWSCGRVEYEGKILKNCQVRYTLSSQVWTVYDLEEKEVTTMINYDSGTKIVQLIGDSTGGIFEQEIGGSDNGDDFSFEYISRWMSFTEMWGWKKSLSGIFVKSTNAGGTLLSCQFDNDEENVWQDIGTLNEDYVSEFPNFISGKDFNKIRFKWSGNTKGKQITFDGIEISKLIPYDGEYS